MKNKIIFIVIAVLVFLALLGRCSADEPQNEPVTKSAEQIQAEQKQQKAEAIKRKNEEVINKANEEMGLTKPQTKPITADKIELLTACQLQVKSQLKDPKSFNMNWDDYRYVVSDEDLRINFPYTAKNALNANVQGRAICVFTRDGKMIKHEIR